MKGNTERKIRNRRISIAIMEYVVALWILLVAFVMFVGKERIKQVSSYARPEEVSRYVVEEDEYITRVRPLTEYNTFKEIAESTLGKEVVVYKDAEEKEEVLEGIIKSGMVIETENEDGEYVVDEGKKYEIRVIGDMTGDGDSNITELTRIIRDVIGTERIDEKGEEISGDFNGDGRIDIVDITMSIRYILYGELPADKEEVSKPEIKVIGEGEEEERENNYYNKNVEVEIIERGKEGEIEKTETTIEMQREGSERIIKRTTEEKEITLTEEARYVIKAQSYGTNGTKSIVEEREIYIDKTIPTLTITREEVDRTQSKILIQARDNRGIGKYSIQRNGEEERSREGIDEKEIKGYVTVRENGIYKVIIEDHAGNKVEEEIDIRDLNNRYTVIFKNEDGSIISQRDYDQGSTVEVPQNPSKAEDNTYTYEFAGWNPEVEETVTENKEYTATYREIYKNYTVTFKDEDGTIITTKNDYHYGDTVTIPENPSKAEDDTYTYRFIGWDKEVSTVVEGNVEYKAVYEATRKEYTITFKDENGTVLTSKTDYHYGDSVAVPQNPSKAEDNTYTYEFIGWSPEVEETVTENKEYTATYRETYKNYTVRFKDEDGTLLAEKTDYHYGDILSVVPAIPTKPEDETNTYEFAGWNQEVQEIVTENREYIATYTSTYKNYAVTFKDENGEILTSKTDYHYGDTVAVPQNPSKQEDNTYTYEFTGWNPEVEETVTENKEYTATYREAYKNYTVTFKDEDGTAISTKNDYHYGDIITVPAIPTKPEDETNTYEFAGWNQEVQETVTENREYIATYTSTYKNYVVTFKDENGTVLTSKTDYHYGDSVAIPQNPTKQEDNTYTYEFTGWKTINDQEQEVIVTPEEIASETVTGNKEYTATYRETYKNYTVTFKDEDGTVITTKNDYHYNDTISIPDNPSKAENNVYTYEFKGWTPEIDLGTEEEPKELKVTGNIEYIATYEAKYKEYVVTFKQDTGEILSNLGHHYGDKVRLPEDPHKLSTMENAYTFTGWNKVEEGQQTPVTKEEITNTEVTKEIEYVATYEEQKINYNLFFYNDDYNEETKEGTIIERRTYNYGDTIEFPEARKEETEEIRYVFESWENLGTEQESETEINITFRAKYREEYYVARLEPIIQTVETTNEETGETVTEEQVILEGKSYLTLKEAVEEARRQERTIKMLKDTEESVLVEDDQNITINLNGKTIRGNKNYVIKNYGELKVVNIADNEGKILENSEEEIGYGIYNREGKVSIESGTIAAETNRENGEAYAIYNQSESPLLITGGSVIAEAKGTNSVGAGIYNLAGEEIKVTGGLVYGNAIGEGTTTYGIYNETEGKVEVTGGIIQARASLSSGVSYGIYNKISEEVEFKGGQIIVQSDRNRAYGIYNEEGKVTLGEISDEEHKGTISVTGSEGYGVYNDRGTIEENTADITMIGSTTYGIYNKNDATINRVTINNRNNERNTYGIYNSANKNISIQNVEIIGGEYGIYSTNGNITVNGANITSEQGILTSNNSQTMTIERVNIESTSNGVNNGAGTVILKEVTINSNTYGIYTNNTGITEIGQKDGTIDTEKPYIYGKTYAVYLEPNSEGNIKYYDGKLQGQNAIYGGISDIEENIVIRIETIENEGRTEEVTVLQSIEERNIARIGEVEYATLAEAVVAVPENQETPITVEIINDGSISTTVEIPENKNVVIDLKGHKLTTYARGGIINKGTLEIVDTQENNQNTEATIETIETLETIESKVGIGITNEGTLVLTGGKIKSNRDGINNINNGQVKLQGGTIEAVRNGINNNLSNISTIMRNTKTEVISGTIKAEKGIDNYYGQVTVTGGKIEGIDYGLYNSKGKVNIIEGQVKAENFDGLFTTSGEVTIEGGEVLSTNRSDYYNSSAINVVNGTTMIITGGRIEGKEGIRNVDSDITIGEKNGTVINDNPVIIGAKYGIEHDSRDRNIKYYDGKILGKEEAIYGSVNELENNKKIVINTETIDEQEYKVIQLVEENSNGIAQIGENTYTTVSSLKQAIKEIPGNTENLIEIKILNNIELTQTLEIENNQKIQLDLNGKEIRGIASIINRGELEITDKTENAEGKIINTNRNCIVNEGILRILNGRVEGKNYGINNYSNTEVTIGNKNEEVETSMPVVKGENIAINGSINMYDGQLRGVKEGYSISNIRDTEEEYEVYNYYEENEYITTLRLEDPVARKGETDYYSIQTAIDELQEGETIELLKSVINLKHTIIIPENKTINMDLKGYVVNSNLDKTVINNGTLTIENGNGTIRNTKTAGITIENNGTLNLNNNTIEEMSTLGKAIENKGVLNMTGGRIKGDTYAVENKENGKINMTEGTIESYNYGIYNESTEDIDIIEGTIQLNHKSSTNSTLYGIYNDADSKINITGGSIISNNYISTRYESYVYGIYNEANGEVNIGEQGKIELGTTKNNYGIYNKGNGNVTSEGTIRVNGQYLAYGIRNSSQGEVKETKGNITVTSEEGTATGIENGVFGGLEITGGSIQVNTETGTAYGINNISTKMIKVKEGSVKATGEESYGIYSNTGDIEIGENDEEIKTLPAIEGDKVGIYVNATDTKFKFYDGKIIGKQATNTEVIVPEGYRLFKYPIDDKEVAILLDQDSHIATFWNEDKTQVIAKIPFKSTDTTIEEPEIPEREGYIGYWTYYEIGDQDIETQLYYVIKRTNGTKLQATDEYGLTWNYTYNNGRATNVYYESGDIEALDGIVNIPARLDGYPVINLYNSLGNIYNNISIFVKSKNATNTTVKQVIIPNSVTIIGSCAFFRCTSITAIKIPNSVLKIDSRAFSMCTSITAIEIPNEINIGDSAFSNCQNMIRFRAPLLKKISNAPFYESLGVFYNCMSLIEIEIPQVTSIGNKAFLNCSSLTRIDMPNVESIGNKAFLNCSSLTAVNMPNVTSIGDEAFKICRSLTAVNMPNVTNIGEDAFLDCYNIEYIKIGYTLTNIPIYGGTLKVIEVNEDNTEYSSQDGVLYNKEKTCLLRWPPCANPKKIRIIDSVTSIGDKAFRFCSSLTEIDMPNVTSIGSSAFSECTGLTSVEMPNVTSIGDYAFYGCTCLTSVDMPNVTSIGSNVFYICCNLTEIEMPNVTSIGDYAFYGCTGLTSVDMPNVTSIGEAAFNRCSSLTEIDMPNVTSIGSNVFYICCNLTEIDMPNVTSIGDYAFSECTGLTSVEMPNVTSIGDGAFCICSKLLEIDMPSVTSIGNNAFSGCSSLTSIEIPEGVTNIEYETFSKCTGLTQIEIPSSVTSIGNSAFSGCSSLTSIEIPEGIINIEYETFSKCTGLTQIEIPSSVTSIGFKAFYGWTENQTIYIEAESQPDGWNYYWNSGCNANIVWGYKDN